VVNLLCILCSRILTYRELLMIFFHDKHWYRSEPLFSLEEEEEDEDYEEEDERLVSSHEDNARTPSPALSQATVTAEALAPAPTKKPEYEFLLFNYLLRFVHREGQIGEFARAGLLFLMDIAMSSPSPSHPIVSGADPVNDAALALAEYILDGDFSEVLSAGLVAVYSLLPTKLGFTPSVPDEKEGGVASMTIGNSGLENEDVREQVLALKDRNRALGIEDAHSPDFKARLDHFLKLLEFLQDVLRKNVETEGPDASLLIGGQIVQSILDAVRRIFLENILYNSILECSDTDGSSVAVMSYIDLMVRTLRPGPLLNLLVDFLTEEDNEAMKFRSRNNQLVTLGNSPPPVTSANDKANKHRRRKSSAMALLEMEAPESRKKSEYFTSNSRFTLRDLLLTNLKSKNQASGTTALQLLNTMLAYQPSLTSEKVLVVIPDSQATAFPHPVLIHGPNQLASSYPEDDDRDGDFRYPGAPLAQTSLQLFEPLYLQPSVTYSTHEREMGLYLALISRVDPQAEGFSTGYDRYLQDALVSIQSQPFYWVASELPFDSMEGERYKHRLNANDPLLSRLLESTRSFFSNTPDFNVGLTGVFATLALNPYRSLAGWLTFAQSDQSFGTLSDRERQVDDEDIRDDRSADFKIDEKLRNETNVLPAARMDEHSRPVVYTVFQSLVNQLERYRQQVEDFDKYLTERRQGLLFSENLTDALQISLDEEPTLVKPRDTPAPVDKPSKTVKTKSSAASALVSLWSPRRSKPKPSPESVTPTRQAAKAAPSPFSTHYQQTSSITVEPVIAPVPFTALWTPSKKHPATWSAVEEDAFNSGWADRSMSSTFSGIEEDEVEEEVFKPRTVTLSQLLDNVVILEESIKELVAIIHARRSLGIDALRYL